MRAFTEQTSQEQEQECTVLCNINSFKWDFIGQICKCVRLWKRKWKIFLNHSKIARFQYWQMAIFEMQSVLFF